MEHCGFGMRPFFFFFFIFFNLEGNLRFYGSTSQYFLKITCLTRILFILKFKGLIIISPNAVFVFFTFKEDTVVPNISKQGNYDVLIDSAMRTKNWQELKCQG